MNALTQLLSLPEEEKRTAGLLFTPREIFQQPETWGTSVQKFLRLRAQLSEFLRRAGLDRNSERPTVVLIGAGTSHYVGRALVHLLRKEWQCEVETIPSTDLLTNFEDLVLPRKSYLWVSFSRSGDSPEGVAVIETSLSRHPDIRHLIITCNKDGSMAQWFREHPDVFCVVLDEATNDQGVAMTSSFTNLVIAGQCLAHFRDLSKYQKTLHDLVALGRGLLETTADVAAQLAAEPYSKVCFLGTGALNAVAHESALKVLEMTAGKTHAIADSFLGIRHGPLSALDNQTLVVCLLSEDPARRAYEIDLLEEIRTKRLGRKLIAVTGSGGSEVERLAEQVISLGPNKISDQYRPPVDVIFGQLLALFSSLQYGLQPDVPSPNGAIARVVSSINIYR
jgi:tagatose-6-phosphate ketose/aldose isomerase